MNRTVWFCCNHLTIKTSMLALICLLLLGCESSGVGRRIAHAGGGYRGATYTDSFEALNENFARGFKTFEIDLSWTSDNHLVCIHNWSVKPNTRNIDTIPTLEEFKRLTAQGKPYHNCTLSGLAKWLRDKPGAVLVTDIKRDNIKGLSLVAKEIKDFQNVVIPQIYQPENYQRVKEIGFKKVIWTLYKYNRSNEEVLSQAAKMRGLYAITMPKSRARSGLAKRLNQEGFYTYTHTVNTISELNYYKKLGIDNVYTDFLLPN